MSHIATGIVQRRQTGSSANKAVLMFMAACASDDGSGIWTSKANIAADLEMSKRTVQRAVDALLAASLISEVGQRKCRNGFTVEYRINIEAIEKLPSTRDTMSPVSPCHLTGVTMSPHGVSQCHPNLTGTILEPLCAADAANTGLSDFFDRFFAVYPRAGDREKTEAALKKAVCQDGVSCETILSGAKAYAAEQKGNLPRYVAYSENWVEQKRWLQFATTAKPVSPDVILEQRAKAIRERQSWVGRHVSAASARELISRELVTVEQCRAAGVVL
ncbi:helix-turn-helix domain-containing protein [uncultured Ruegeria sp.]|uniref:helix-turn-helix domain-containing protein n=1 Tax=uncultured Ruegeria sp. TaxID=259304 RepID=UPI00260EF46E|nr:helix-turn-helix domain-containing protein [uncultured Ruegeria sp.]